MNRVAQELLSVARTIAEAPVWYEQDDFDEDAYDLLLSKLIKVAREKNFDIISLGEIDGWPMFLLEHYREKTTGPNVLIVSGFHGEEQAGPWGVLRYMELVPREVLHAVNLSFIPVVNPSGFRKGKRKNVFNESPNGGFRPEVEDDELSVEGKILMAHMGELKRLATDVFISLHEDGDMKEFYMYVYEGDVPSELTKVLLDVGVEHFGMLKDQKINEPGKGTTKDGLVVNEHDGSFEDKLREQGCAHSYATETPMKRPMDERIRCSVELIDALVKHVIENKSA
jgi:hypothetical protein